MAGHKVAHATLKGPNLAKEIIMGIIFGFAAGGVWKKNHREQQRRTKLFYEALDRGEVTVVPPQ